ncbi:MAG: 50S ribosomal protein L6 [Candidatus Bathyarchaeota archaeon]
MKKRIARETIKIPESLDVSVDQNMVSVKGPLGTLERSFYNAPVDIRRESDEILIEAIWPDKKRLALVGTIKSHIRNMLTGVTNGFTYKLKIVYAHFPMSVKVQNEEVLVENFGGERMPRKIKIPNTVKAEVTGDDIIVKGINLEEVSQAAANIQQATLIRNKDPRIFLDGIYIYDRGKGK